VDDLLPLKESTKRARVDAAESTDAQVERGPGRRVKEKWPNRLRKQQKAASPLPPSDPPPISRQDLYLVLQLPHGLTEEKLKTSLARYGSVEDLVFAPANGDGSPSALVCFTQDNWIGCWACMYAGAGIGAKTKWPKGEPAWVKWAAQQKETKQLADRIDLLKRYETDAATETATLLQKRQRERELLAEEIRRAEAEEE
jgi:hypothetical protein